MGMETLPNITAPPHHEVLMIATLLMATVSMVLSSLALLPHVKSGVAMVRDAVLWAALVVVFVSLVGIGWRYWKAQSTHGLDRLTPPATSVVNAR